MATMNDLLDPDNPTPGHCPWESPVDEEEFKEEERQLAYYWRNEIEEGDEEE